LLTRCIQISNANTETNLVMRCITSHHESYTILPKLQKQVCRGILICTEIISYLLIVHIPYSLQFVDG